MTLKIRATITERTATATIETTGQDRTRYSRAWSGEINAVDICDRIGHAAAVIRFGVGSITPTGWNATAL